MRLHVMGSHWAFQSGAEEKSCCGHGCHMNSSQSLANLSCIETHYHCYNTYYYICCTQDSIFSNVPMWEWISFLVIYLKQVSTEPTQLFMLLLFSCMTWIISSHIMSKSNQIWFIRLIWLYPLHFLIYYSVACHNISTSIPTDVL